MAVLIKRKGLHVTLPYAKAGMGVVLDSLGTCLGRVSRCTREIKSIHKLVCDAPKASAVRSTHLPFYCAVHICSWDLSSLQPACLAKDCSSLHSHRAKRRETSRYNDLTRLNKLSLPASTMRMLAGAYHFFFSWRFVSPLGPWSTAVTSLS